MKLKDNIKQIELVKQNITRLAILREQITNFSWQRQEVKSFIVVCRGRSGTTCFLDLLSSHPQVLSDPHNFFDYENLPLNFERVKFVNSQKNVFGFKFRSPKNESRSLENIASIQAKYRRLAEQGVIIFYLKRHNLLKRSVSEVVANTKRQKFNYRHRDEIPDNQFNLSPEEVIAALTMCEEEARFDEQVMGGVPHIPISYESDLEHQHSHQATLDRCCEALGLDRAVAQTQFIKIAPPNFEEYITNWSQVSSSIANSQYKSWLIEPSTIKL